MKTLWLQPERRHLQNLFAHCARYRSLLQPQHWISHRTLQDIKDRKKLQGKNPPSLVRNFRQSGWGLGFLSHYNQKSLSILSVYTSTVERKKGKQVRKEKTLEQWLYTSIILRMRFLITWHWWKKMNTLTFSHYLRQCMYSQVGEMVSCNYFN